jgi:tetratricopeptide (TPR) repeat protein
MASDTPTAAIANADSEIWAAVSAFEKILEAVPTDRLAIETLADAFEKLGDKAKSQQYLLRLVDVVLLENDSAAGPALIEKLEAYGREEAMLQARKRVEQMLARDAAARMAAEKNTTTVRKAADITHEVSLAWELLQEAKLSQAEYSAVVQDLSENSSKRIDVPVSVLHALADRQFKGMDKVLTHLCKLSGLPLIVLSSFELNPEAFMLLPMEFMTRRGAIVFDLMGRDALVAVLNPVDKDLQADVKRVLKRACHFYLSNSSDYDAVLAAIRKHIAARDEQADDKPAE